MQHFPFTLVKARYGQIFCPNRRLGLSKFENDQVAVVATPEVSQPPLETPTKRDPSQAHRNSLTSWIGRSENKDAGS
jgi:hypothetical protein